MEININKTIRIFLVKKAFNLFPFFVMRMSWDIKVLLDAL